ncbi:chorismate-binding protein [Streptomyces californicus]
MLVADQAHTLELAGVLAPRPARDRVEDRAFDVPDGSPGHRRGGSSGARSDAARARTSWIRRTLRGAIPGFARADAVALFRRLLAGERGAYWTFVGAHGRQQARPGLPLPGRRGATGGRTPRGRERRRYVRMSGGTVVMNPISGTYRYPDGGPTAESLLAFLGDRKESEELSMVVDEELKIMCTVGDMGGVVVGPRLKEMAHLAHTEYELRGKSSLDVREVLRETMFAATVTGSPVQNACRVIERYKSGGARLLRGGAGAAGPGRERGAERWTRRS